MNNLLDCSICGEKIQPKSLGPDVDPWLEGNNASPINDGRCCDTCNSFVVIPARLAVIHGNQLGDVIDKALKNNV